MSQRLERELKRVILLAGGFCFAFLAGELVHELGHLLAHRYFGTGGVSMHLDPFGGSRIYGVQALPLRQMGITTAAGPGLNLIGGTIAALLVWKSLRPALLPLALWGPVALIQEGVNLSLGLLSPGSDAQWLVQWGCPGPILALLGAVFILGGTVGISFLLASCALDPKSSYWGRFGVTFFGLGFLMLLRAAVSLFRSPAAVRENWIPLAFVFLLALIISGLSGPLVRRGKEPGSGSRELAWGTSLLAGALGIGMLLLEISLP